jgi:MFS family permease
MDDDSDDGRGEPFCLAVQFWPTLCFLGISMSWAILYGYLTPSLLSYDLDINLVGTIWFLGSFLSLLVCPLVGAASDFTAHPWGRRRIYIVSFLPLACGGLVLLAYSERLGAWLGDVEEDQSNALALAIVGLMVRLFLFGLHRIARMLVVGPMTAQSNRH